MPGSATLSDVLGYTSIACWLGAQLPQVLENIRNQSCEGLALPFLANWFLGDFFNLVGCILTHQLPFQTYLATYFVCIDLVLVIQFFYYAPHRNLGPPPSTPATAAFAPPYAFSPAATIRQRHSLERTSSAATATLPTSATTTAARYRTLSAVAANVAAAAALAAQQGELQTSHTHVYPTSHDYKSPNLTSSVPLMDAVDGHGQDGQEDHEADYAPMMDSFHSEGGGGRRGRNKRRIAWSIERSDGSTVDINAGNRARTRTVTADEIPTAFSETRGRSTQRQETVTIINNQSYTPLGHTDANEDPQLGTGEGENWEETDRFISSTSHTLPFPTTPSHQRRNSRAGKKSATMVFLGVWALFSVGSLVNNRRGLPIKDLRLRGSGLGYTTGKVLGATAGDVDIPIADVSSPSYNEAHPVQLNLNEKRNNDENEDLPPFPPPPNHEPPEYEPEPDIPFTERVIGRIFAWLCTCFYLSSRLPQIWKNFVRKSVEGLTMYLFVFAFLGNLFYVASILSSPNLQLPVPASTRFIRESIPYLLGSGGTLMFDITIVMQSFIYKPKTMRDRSRRRALTQTRNRTRTRTRSGSRAFSAIRGADIYGHTYDYEEYQGRRSRGDADMNTTVEERAGLLAGDTLAHHRIHSRDIEGGWDASDVRVQVERGRAPQSRTFAG